MAATRASTDRRLGVVSSAIALAVVPAGAACGTDEPTTDAPTTSDHAAEQPFTRQTTVEIPDDVDEITVEGRDQVGGYGGATVTVAVPREG